METPTIWVISPDLDTRHLIGLNLRKRGFSIMEISPQDTLPPAWASPQLIILDVDPSSVVDWEMAEILRRKSWGQGVPLILLLATAPTSSQLTPFEPVHWVEKPLAIDILLNLVSQSISSGAADDGEEK